MSADEYLPAVFIILGIYLLIRFLGRTPTPNDPDTIPGVSASTVDTIHAAFPDVPLPNLIYSLSKTRSGQRTSEEIMEKGYLPNPPASFRMPSSLQPATVNPPSAPSSPVASTGGFSSKSPAVAKQPSLIERYGLANRVPSRKGKEVDAGERPEAAGQDEGAGENQASGGKANWADSREGREKVLRERKERMILEARRRMMEKEAQATSAAS